MTLFLKIEKVSYFLRKIFLNMNYFAQNQWIVKSEYVSISSMVQSDNNKFGPWIFLQALLLKWRWAWRTRAFASIFSPSSESILVYIRRVWLSHHNVKGWKFTYDINSFNPHVTDQPGVLHWLVLILMVVFWGCNS